MDHPAASLAKPQALDRTRRRRELLVFFFLTMILIPGLAIGLVGAYGFCVWMFQLIAGPPTG